MAITKITSVREEVSRRSAQSSCYGPPCVSAQVAFTVFERDKIWFCGERQLFTNGLLSVNGSMLFLNVCSVSSLP